MSVRAYLGLGANLGDRRANMRAALALLAEQCTIIGVSSLYRSAAVVAEGAAPGPDFLNAACMIETELTARELLALAKEIEHTVGRRPAERWAPRPIDIDIELYGGEIIATPDLVVPHPLMLERDFVLVPLAEIAADVVHPAAGLALGELALKLESVALERVEGPEWASDAR